METERRILKSTTVLLTASLTSQLANFVFVVYFARAYEPAILGEYSFALSLGALTAIFVTLGANSFLLRKWSEDASEWRSDVGVLLPVQVILATLLCLAILATGWALGLTPIQLKIITIVSALQLITPIWGLLAIGFTASERMAQGAFADVGIRLSIMIVGGTAIAAGAPAELTLLILPLSGAATAIVLYRLASAEYGTPRFRVDAAALGRLWRESLTFFLSLALAIVYARIGFILLRSLSGAEEVGMFAPAERLVMAAGLLHVTFANAIYPALIRFAQSDERRFMPMLNRCMRVIALVSLPAATVLFLFARDLIMLLFGSDYADAVYVLEVAAWLVALRGVTTLYERAGFATDRRRLVLLGKAVALVCLFILAFPLLPAMGALGLAVALVASQSLKLTVVGVGLARSGVGGVDFRPFLPVLGACALTAGLTMLAGVQPVWQRVAIVVSCGMALLWLLGAIRAPDLRFLHRMLRGASVTSDPTDQS